MTASIGKDRGGRGSIDMMPPPISVDAQARAFRTPCMIASSLHHGYRFPHAIATAPGGNGPVRRKRIDKALADLGEHPWRGERSAVTPVLQVRGVVEPPYLFSVEAL